MNVPVNVFIGYDPKEAIAYHVLSHSILRRASGPVRIQPVALNHLRDVYNRPRGATESTEFSISRFLVPYLSGYRGISVYMDCDMLCLGDLFAMVRGLSIAHQVTVVKHEYTPKAGLKMDGQVQTVYPRKNWSSLMVFDNARCTALSPHYVNTASGLDLHRFNWLESSEAVGDASLMIEGDERLIGKLPLEWNWLVGEYEPNPKAKILHYTLGGPWLEAYAKCDHAEEWRLELQNIMHPNLICV